MGFNCIELVIHNSIGNFVLFIYVGIILCAIICKGLQ